MGTNESIDELRETAERSIASLAASTDPAAFQALLALSERVGVALGESARAVAASSSWAAVGEMSGTTKQAAWSRWR